MPKFLTVCPNICAINIMHTPLDEILPALRALKKCWTGPMGCYPNNAAAGNRLDWQGQAKSYEPDEFASAVPNCNYDPNVTGTCITPILACAGGWFTLHCNDRGSGPS